jgi:hypothetical protein
MRNRLFKQVSGKDLWSAWKIFFKLNFGYVVISAFLLFASVSQYMQYSTYAQPLEAANTGVVLAIVFFLVANVIGVSFYVRQENQKDN